MDETDAMLPEKPEWLEGSTVNEVVFCREFLEENPMKSVNGSFFTPDGVISDEGRLKKQIFDLLKPFITTNLTKKVSNLIEVLRIECHSDSFPIQTDRIHVANGTLYLNGRFTPEKEFCHNRLSVSYQPDAPEPEHWLKFLDELLEPDDILTLQEYLGYCLIPSTKGQTMMIILGNGGEGKSRIGLVLAKMLGSAAVMDSIQKIETNRFARADLEYKLLMIDDDMEISALPKTSTLKTIVTAESKMDLERKGVQSYQGQLFARFLCFGNGELTSLNDQSLGFYRRQLVLYAKAPAPGRINDPYLAEKMIPEMDGIFLWCLDGLHRLLRNRYRFTFSSRAKMSMEVMQQSTNSVEAFMHSSGYFDFIPEASVSSKELFDIYRQFCTDNAFRPLSDRQLSTELNKVAGRYGLKSTNNIYLPDKRRVRGFEGIQVRYRVLF